VRTLVLGGIRSGKSRWAEENLAESLAPDEPVCYLASGSSGEADPEWAQRVAKHRDRRPAQWSTVESDDIATQLRQSPGIPTLVDDLGGWLTRVLDRHRGWDDDSAAAPVQRTIDDMIAAVSTFGSTLMVVSPEVGLTVVPATASARRFADELGTLNQRMAAICDRVILVVAGQAVPIKTSGA
jgi:adenosylcobinamide kinase / adenosylcobinamide-phosphate guanylyltransferase